MESRFSPGSLVSARGRDWVVLPPFEPEVLRLRPLTSGSAEEVGLFVPLEGRGVRRAEFAPPEPTGAGDATGVMTLFDAARLSLRSGAAPFRSLGRVSVVANPLELTSHICEIDGFGIQVLCIANGGNGFVEKPPLC